MRRNIPRFTRSAHQEGLRLDPPRALLRREWPMSRYGACRATIFQASLSESRSDVGVGEFFRQRQRAAALKGRPAFDRRRPSGRRRWQGGEHGSFCACPPSPASSWARGRGLIRRRVVFLRVVERASEPPPTHFLGAGVNWSWLACERKKSCYLSLVDEDLARRARST